MSKSREDKVHLDLRAAVDAVASARPDGGDTLLTYAVKTKNHDLVEHLLTERKLSVDAPDSLKNTGLYIAAQNNDAKMIDLLLKYGADPNIPNGKGMEPLVLAYKLENDAIIDKLLPLTKITDQIADKILEIEDKQKRLTDGLYKAIEKGDLKMVDALLKDGANPNKVNKSGMEPLVRAFELGHDAIVEKLLEKTNVTNAMMTKLNKLEEQLNNPEVTIKKQERKSGGKIKVKEAVDEVVASTKNIYASFLDQEKEKKIDAIKSLDEFIKDNIKPTVSTYQKPEKEPIPKIERNLSSNPSSTVEISHEAIRRPIK